MRSPGLTPAQLTDVSAALLAFWTSRDEAAEAQRLKGQISDAGTRSSVTSGGHLDRVAQLFASLSHEAGVPWEDIYYKAPDGAPNKRSGYSAGFTLPGYYRPTKQWDVVAWHGGEPIVALELKSQVGSLGNNANNRAEEAIGNAVDFHTACRDGLIPGDVFTGYVFVLEDTEDANALRGDRDRGYLPKHLGFEEWTYADRISELGSRLVRAGLYDAAWTVQTKRPPRFDWREMNSPRSGYGQFVARLQAHLAKFYDGPTDDEPLTLL